MVNSSSFLRGTLRRFVQIVLAFCLVCLSGVAHAANNCPWLTEATASGLIGADAGGSYTAAAGAQPAVCIFTQKSEGMARTLTIAVERAQDAHGRMTAIAQACADVTAARHERGKEA